MRLGHGENITISALITRLLIRHPWLVVMPYIAVGAAMMYKESKSGLLTGPDYAGGIAMLVVIPPVFWAMCAGEAYSRRRFAETQDDESTDDEETRGAA